MRVILNEKFVIYCTKESSHECYRASDISLDKLDAVMLYAKHETLIYFSVMHIKVTFYDFNEGNVYSVLLLFLLHFHN